MPDSERAITTAARRVDEPGWMQAVTVAIGRISDTLNDPSIYADDGFTAIVAQAMQTAADIEARRVVREEHDRLRGQATDAFLNELDVLAESSQYDPSLVRDARIAVGAMRRMLALLGESTQEQASD